MIHEQHEMDSWNWNILVHVYGKLITMTRRELLSFHLNVWWIVLTIDLSIAMIWSLIVILSSYTLENVQILLDNVITAIKLRCWSWFMNQTWQLKIIIMINDNDNGNKMHSTIIALNVNSNRTQTNVQIS